MSDLISRSALLDDMKNELEKAVNEDLQEDECKAILTSAIALKSFVNRQPTVEAIPKEKLDEIVERLEAKKKNICGSYFYATPTLETPSHKVAFNNGISEAIEIVKGVMND